MRCNYRPIKQIMARHDTGLKFWQINLDRARHTTDELREAAHREGADVLLLQEPHTARGAVTGFSAGDAVITGTKQGERPWAAVIVLNRHINVLQLSHLSTPHTVCVELTSHLGAMLVVSCYMQHSVPTEQFIQELREITRQHRNQRIIIGTDSNAKSTLWGAPTEDEAGVLLEDFMAEADLIVLNDPEGGPTYSSDTGETYIDVTMASPRLSAMQQTWKLRPEIVTGTHKLIETVMQTGQPEGLHRVAQRRYNMNKANWQRFGDQLEQHLPTLPEIHSKDDTYSYARQLQKAITKAADASIPRKVYRRHAVPWWSNTLTDLKKMTYTARQDSQQHHLTRDERQEKRIAYRAIRRIYTRAVRATKKESWRDFISAEAQNGLWGMAYKLQAQKFVPSQVLSSIRTQDAYAATWNDAATELLNVLIREDKHDEDDPQHRVIRRESEHLPATEDSRLLDLLDLDIAKGKLRNKTAPGTDNITPEIIKHGWPHLSGRLLYLFNACLQHGAFPRAWKHGQIKALLKDQDREKTDPKSYRPICLLPVIGKLFERLLAELLTPTLEEGAAPSQHGFRTGRSTEGAITALYDRVQATQERYAIGLFIDFEGAFDTLWWPSILTALKNRRCPRNAYMVLQDYFRGRTVSIAEHYHSVWKPNTVGCPQGSVLGPKLWNVVMDRLLALLEALPEAYPVAYADDLVIVIEGSTRRELEIRAAVAMGMITNWTQENKLQLSRRKTVGMMLKGTLDPERPPIVRLGPRSIRFVQQVKYLGVTIQARMAIDAHVRETASKAKNLFHALGRLSGTAWGYKTVHYHLLYRTLFQQICSYAAHGWARQMKQKHKKILLSAQRQALIRCTKAYATVPTSGMPVIMGVLPIDLYVERRIQHYKIKKGLPVSIGDLEIEPGNQEDPDYLTDARRRVEEQLEIIWQRRWDEAVTGRITYEYFPNVVERRRQRWVRPGHHVTQLMTGHGSFRAKLASFGLAEDRMCHCYQPGEDDARHVLYDCTNYNGFRGRLRERAQTEDVVWPPPLQFWTRKTAYPVFQQYANRVLGLRESEEPRRRRQQQENDGDPE